MNNLRAQREGLAVVGLGLLAALATLKPDVIVAIAADRTVKPAAAGDVPIGRLSVEPHAVTKKCTVETRFKEFLEMKGSGAIVAGDRLKLAAPSGEVQRVAKWVAGTDAVDLLFGVAWSGGADDATIEVLSY